MKETIYSFIKQVTLFIMLTMPSVVYSQLSDWSNYTYTGMIYSMLDDGDYLWLATDAGVVKFNKNTEEKVFYNRTNASLPENKILKLAKDSDGNIWMTSYRYGIGKLEGNKCTVYNSSNSGLLSDQMCDAIIIDKENNKWIGSAGCLTKFDGNKWESWTTPNSSIYNNWFIHSLKFDKENVFWVGGIMEDQYLARFDGKELQLIDGIIGEVNKIEFDNNGVMWLATKGGLMKYDGSQFVSYTTQNSNIPENYLSDLVIDDKGNIWLACLRNLVCFDGKDFIKYETPLINDDNNFIRSLVISNDQTIWLGTRRNGLIKYSDGNFKAVNLGSSSLVTNGIGFNGQVDSERNYWFNTHHNLIKVDKDNVWHSYLEKIDNYSAELRIGGFGVDPSGNVWTALGRSDTIVTKMKDGKVTAAFTRKNTACFKPFIQADCRFNFDEKGNVWLASRTGLYKYDGSKWTWYTAQNSPFISNTVFDVAFDKEGNMWGGTGNEFDKGCLFKYDGTNWEIFTPENSGLPTTIVAALAFDSKNNLWLHCRDRGNSIGQELGGGLTKYDGNTWTTYNTRNSGIPSNSILDITIDKNDDLWLATYGGVGITHYDGKTWTSYNMENSGIAYNEVSKITLDYGRDCVWLNHLDSRGISTAKLNWGSSIESNRLNNQNEGFVIYSDATSTNLHLRFNDNVNPEKLELFDMSGRLICSRKLGTSVSNDFNVSLSELNIRQNGLYLVKLITPTNIFTQRLIVKM